MDPAAALARLHDADDVDEALDALEDLAEWTMRGGFVPAAWEEAPGQGR